MAQLRLPVMLYKGLLKDDACIDAFMDTSYAAEYLLACGALNTDILYRSRIHGQGHIERVMLLGALIAKAQKLSRRETRLLLFACSYHDIGRVDDRKDDLHGRRSAEMIVSRKLTDIPGDFSSSEIQCLQAAVCTHSVNDGRLPEISGEFHVSSEEYPLCLKLCRCLKDADNLDRVRLHDLDTRHLRHESSVAMKDTAEFIYKTYRKYRDEI